MSGGSGEKGVVGGSEVGCSGVEGSAVSKAGAWPRLHSWRPEPFQPRVLRNNLAICYCYLLRLYQLTIKAVLQAALLLLSSWQAC